MKPLMKLPEHSGSFVREKGGWRGYHKWCEDNMDNIKVISFDGETRLVVLPIRVHKVGRNQPCPCNSGAKYKRCCLND